MIRFLSPMLKGRQRAVAQAQQQQQALNLARSRIADLETAALAVPAEQPTPVAQSVPEPAAQLPVPFGSRRIVRLAAKFLRR